ncbi:hypothetical protein LOZ43_005853 [Ophidiomyces ophidiicola]|nr:hypothetical protein LOZ43_005853 [Ophidiomyces ophidiicola]
MADRGSHAALLSYQDDEEATPRRVEAHASAARRRSLFSKNGKAGPLMTFFSLNIVTVVTALVLMVLFGGIMAPLVSRRVMYRRDFQCSTVEDGYRCYQPEAMLWGQYSPYSTLKFKSPIPQDVPRGCTVNFAQMLSRHGARYPTESKTKAYAKLITKIQNTTTSYMDKFKFLQTFKYELLSAEMTEFGNTQLVHSGSKFYRRYQNLAKNHQPFVRASGSSRVIKSAERFIDGFHQFKLRDPDSVGKEPPKLGLIIPEGDFNNTLDHAICTNFEKNEYGDDVQKKFLATFAPKILERVKKGLVGADLSTKEVIYMMDMCSFHTVALTKDASKLSPFCELFTRGEWIDYDYYQSLGKYYGYGNGHPLGPEQGIGFTNELIARLTNTPVKDNTSTNRTLNANPATFPLNATLYAGFSHDNTMTSIFAALGLFNGTTPLPMDRVQTPAQSNGYAASWTVPFGARAYVEKMTCDWSPKKNTEYVRILINDRVFPLYGCKVDSLGRCELNDFVQGLGFARSGGKWASCFK